MLEDILEILIAGATSGAVQVLTVRASGEFTGQYKDATELVTQADQRSDAAILGIFESRFRALDPTISWRLEESGASGPQGARWVGADPLDGTNLFAAGGTAYSGAGPRCGERSSLGRRRVSARGVPAGGTQAT